MTTTMTQRSLSLAAAADAMAHRLSEAADQLSGASEVMQGTSFPWPPKIEANWQRMHRRCGRRRAAWQRLAAARNRREAAS